MGTILFGYFTMEINLELWFKSGGKEVVKYSKVFLNSKLNTSVYETYGI